MDQELWLQTGVCKVCKQETFLLTSTYRTENEGEEECEENCIHSGCFCPNCGSDDFSPSDELGECGYFPDDEDLQDIANILGLETCAHCNCHFLFNGKRRDICLTFRMTDGICKAKGREEISFCEKCLEEASQRDLVKTCANVLSSRGASFSLNRDSPVFSLESIAEAFKTRTIK